MNINIEELIKKNANKFISVRESFERLQETSPKTPPSQIANLLIQYFIANENSSSMRAYLNSNTGEINSIEPLYSDSLEHEKLLRIISEKNLSLNRIDRMYCKDIGTFETGEFIYIDQLDTLGWYREGFNKTLDVNHNNVSGEEMADCSNNSDIHESNTEPKVEEKELPAWFKPNLGRTYFTIKESTELLYLLNDEDGKKDGHVDNVSESYGRYMKLIDDGLDSARLKLASEPQNEPKHHHKITAKSLKQFCDKVGLYFPLPIDDDDTHAPTTGSDAEQVSELQATIKQLKEELENLREKSKQGLYVNTKSTFFSKEARIGLETWIELTDNGKRGDVVRMTPKQAIRKKLDSHLIDSQLPSKTAKERLSTVFNWNPEGGSPKTGK